MATSKKEKPMNGWRFKLGMILVILSFISPIGTLFIGYSNFSIEWKITLSGLFLAGIPELLILAAVVVLGKEGFSIIKKYLLKLLRKLKPAKEVSRMRYNIGLVMFILPMLYAWVIMYAPFEKYPEFLDHRTWTSLISDISFFGSFLVLGENFWDKLRALFIRKATANFKK